MASGQRADDTPPLLPRRTFQEHSAPASLKPHRHPLPDAKFDAAKKIGPEQSIANGVLIGEVTFDARRVQ